MSNPLTCILSPLTKPESFDLFAQHVSSGKAAFFQAAGIDFVMGRREGPFIWDLDGADLQPIDLSEVAAYYREDVRIWQLYLGLRRLDRTLHRWTRRQYPYVLPGPISR